jgi:hypothetical protein
MDTTNRDRDRDRNEQLISSLSPLTTRGCVQGVDINRKEGKQAVFVVKGVVQVSLKRIE